MNTKSPGNPFRAVRSNCGQAIVEYGSIIAFVGVLIAFAFAWTQNSLVSSISQSSSNMTKQVDRLNIAAKNGKIN